MKRVILILCDALRYDKVSEQIMPYLSGLTEKGTSFDMYFTQAGNTKQSMPFFLSSKREYDKMCSFPYCLSEKGVSTGIVHSNAVLIAQKYQECFNDYMDMGTEDMPVKTKAKQMLKKVGLWRRTRKLRRKLNPTMGLNVPYRRAENILDESERWLEEQKNDHFLWVHLLDTHIPYSPPGYDSLSLEEIRRLNDKILEHVTDEKIVITDEEAAQLEELYDAEASYMDEQIERFVEFYDDSIIFITSDHGEEFGEYGEFSHSPGRHGLTPQLSHVPLIVLGPGVKQQVVSDYATSLDIGPTLLDIFGCEPSLGYGHSLKDLIFER